MPEIRYFTIIEEREVQVSGSNAIEAMALGDRVLSGTQKPEDQINIRMTPRQTHLSVREERF